MIVSLNQFMTIQKHSRLGISTALVSFVIGTFIFLCFYYSSSYNLVFIGYAFIVLAGAVNLVVLLSLIIRSLKESWNKKMAVACGLILLNIPVLIIYVSGAPVLINTMRITFVNDTHQELSKVKISGMEELNINELGAGDDKTVWVRIVGEGSISITYELNRELKHELIAGSVCGGMGQKVEYRIDGIEKELFL